MLARGQGYLGDNRFRKNFHRPPDGTLDTVDLQWIGLFPDQQGSRLGAVFVRELCWLKFCDPDVLARHSSGHGLWAWGWTSKSCVSPTSTTAGNGKFTGQLEVGPLETIRGQGCGYRKKRLELGHGRELWPLTWAWWPRSLALYFKSSLSNTASVAYRLREDLTPLEWLLCWLSALQALGRNVCPWAMPALLEDSPRRI